MNDNLDDNHLGEVIISEEEIAERVEELAAAVNKDYKGKELVVVSILKSALYFTTDLTRQLDLNLKLDLLELSRYTERDNSGVIRVTRDLEFSIADREVLIIENIINTGLTHSYLVKNLKSRNPGSLSICTLINKPDKRLVELPIDYTGFDIPEKFVVGYGLDYHEQYRNLPYIVEYLE